MYAIKKILTKSFFLSKLISLLFLYINCLISIFYRCRIGINNHISFGVKVIGWRHILLGGNVVLSSGTWLNVNNRKQKGISLTIGENSFVGRNNFFTVGRSIRIGPYFLSGSNCSFIGSSHVVLNPFKVYLSTGVTKDNDICVGANCFFGYGVSVVGNISIGHGCVIGANTVILQDIPPFSIVVGNPGVVVKRFDFNSNCWTKDFDSLGVVLSEIEYIDILKSNLKTEYPFMPLCVSKDFFSDMP